MTQAARPPGCKPDDSPPTESNGSSPVAGKNINIFPARAKFF